MAAYRNPGCRGMIPCELVACEKAKLLTLESSSPTP
jgi:hypothetical protein